MSKFDFWNADETEIEIDESEKPKAELVKQLPPQFEETAAIPDTITKAWVEAQLPKSVWSRKNAKLNPSVIAEMSKIAAKTPSKRGLMARFGLHLNTYYLWERKAAAGEQPYALWHQCIMHGFSQLEDELLDNVRGHAVTDWKAAAWYLARLNREEYGEKQSTTQISVQGEGGSKVTINRITDDDAMAIARIMGEIGALPAGDADVVDGEVVGEDES